MKHTPGPWKVVKAYHEEFKEEFLSIQKDMPGDNILQSVCGIFGTVNWNEANAKLIAASPDLLNELIRLYEKHGYEETKKVIDKATT